MQDPTAQFIIPYLGLHSWLGDESPLEGKVRQLLLKNTKEEASAAAAGSLFQSVIVRGKKLYLKQSVDEEYCLYVYLCADLILEHVCGR